MKNIKSCIFFWSKLILLIEIKYKIVISKCYKYKFIDLYSAFIHINVKLCTLQTSTDLTAERLRSFGTVALTNIFIY